MSVSTHVKNGDVVDYTPGSAAAAGDIAFLGTIAGQVVLDTAANELGSLRIEGVIELTKENVSDVIAAGDACLWDATGKVVSSTGADGTLGKAIAASGATDAKVLVKLNA